MDSKLIGCAAYDTVRKQFCMFTFSNSVQEYIRNTVENVIFSCKNLNDVKLYKLCEYDVETGDITPCKEEHSWSEYKMPMSKADALSPLGVDFAQEALEYEEFKRSRKNKE